MELLREVGQTLYRDGSESCRALPCRAQGTLVQVRRIRQYAFPRMQWLYQLIHHTMTTSDTLIFQISSIVGFAESLRDVVSRSIWLSATPKAEELVATSIGTATGRAEKFFLQGMRQRNPKWQVVHRRVSGDDLLCIQAKRGRARRHQFDRLGNFPAGSYSMPAFLVVGTWPVRTEMANRMVASGTNALANSVVLVCRKKETTAEVITRAEFIRALKRELPRRSPSFRPPTSRRPICRNRRSALAWACSRATRRCWSPTTAR